MPATLDKTVSANALGVFRHSRPRPTYAVPLHPDWLDKGTYPKSNSRRIAPEATVHWKLGAWRKVDGSYEGVQVRSVWAAAYKADELACCITAVQTRNGTDGEMHVDAYASTCDDESQELGHHAQVARVALRQFERRNWLWSGEAVTELSGLFVPPAFKNKKLWQPAMLTLLGKLAALNGDEPQVSILKALPLETAWRQQTLSAQAWERRQQGQEPQLERPREREVHLAARRATALQALYEQALGFQPLDGPWMARMVEPMSRVPALASL